MKCAVPGNAVSTGFLLGGPLLLAAALLLDPDSASADGALRQFLHFPALIAIGSLASPNQRRPGRGTPPPLISTASPFWDRLYRQAQAIGQFGSYHALASRFEIRYQAWSHEMVRVLGCKPDEAPTTTDEYLAACVHPDDRAELRRVWKDTLAGATSAVAEYRVIGADGVQKRVFDYIECTRDEKGEHVQMAGLLFDVTERKCLEGERLETAVRDHALIEGMGGIPYISTPDKEGSPVHIGSRIRALLGFPPEQWCAGSGLRTQQLFPEDRARLRNAIRGTLESDMPLSLDYRIRTAAGEVRWVHDEARLVRSPAGAPLFLQGVLFDITRFKAAQEEFERSHRELRALIVALDTRRDEEQRRLARELHDDLGQLLGAMKLDLSSLERQLPQDHQAELHVGRLSGLVDAMLCSVRRIIADLPPKDLEELGLLSALERLVETFAVRHSLRHELRFPSQMPAIARACATAAYRIVQEALNNIARHAAATRVGVQLEVLETLLRIRVADNGKGMDSTDEGREGSFGLIGMRERVTALGGKLQIGPRTGGGTVVTAEIPLA